MVEEYNTGSNLFMNSIIAIFKKELEIISDSKSKYNFLFNVIFYEYSSVVPEGIEPSTTAVSAQHSDH